MAPWVFFSTFAKAIGIKPDRPVEFYQKEALQKLSWINDSLLSKLYSLTDSIDDHNKKWILEGKHMTICDIQCASEIMSLNLTDGINMEEFKNIKKFLIDIFKYQEFAKAHGKVLKMCSD